MVAAVHRLPPESATAREQAGDRAGWSMLAANVAQLVDLLHFWLTCEYQRWITDPHDPQVRRDRARRERDGLRPPPLPLIPPVAHRPPSVHTAAQAAYEQLRDHYATTASPTAGASGRQVSRAEFDAELALGTTDY